MTPHKHADVIIAYANGAVIETRHNINYAWKEIKNPAWFDSREYRIKPEEKKPKFKIGDYVYKLSGSEWSGYVVGTYSTQLTPEGYCVESKDHFGSVQIYPAAALKGNNNV